MALLRLVYRTFSLTNGDRLVWNWAAGRLRILCYHGVCPDNLASANWIPQAFVKESAFASQLEYLKRNTNVLPLSEAVERLRDDSLPPRAVCLTFDDGYANNLSLAYPILRKYRMPATIFLSTAYMESQEFFPFLKAKLVQLDSRIDLRAEPLADYKSSPLDEVDRTVRRWWDQVQARLTGDQIRILRPLRVDEVRNADSELVEFGAHSHTHCILKNECEQRRQEEVAISIRKVAEWTGKPTRLFSYPNGQRGDFGETEFRTLRAEGIDAAVTGIGGSNHSRLSMLELRRYPVALFHDDSGFRAEVTGFRSALLAMGRGVLT